MKIVITFGLLIVFVDISTIGKYFTKRNEEKIPFEKVCQDHVILFPLFFCENF